MKDRSRMILRTIALVVVLGPLGACVTNPVTGERELGLVSESQERQIGEQQYLPSRQMQGGDYITNPGVAAYVSEVGQKLAAVSDRPLDYEFAVLNNSVPNAWALPGGKIAVNRGLLMELESEAELAAVLGHEIVHAAARHGARGMERGLLLQGAVLAAAVASSDNDYSNYVVGGASIAAQLVNQKYGRDQELESDYYGMRYMAEAGYDPQGAVDLQQTFVRLSEGRNQDWLSGLFASHPPSEARVEANRRTAAELPAGGRVGKDAYRRRLAPLLADREAYEKHDEGRKALAAGDAERAVSLARSALATEPEEAQFHGLIGDARYAQGRFREAVDAYSEALRRHDRYFKYYLGRGESYRRLGRRNEAQRDLTASAELLPTADAYRSLGLLAEAAGNDQRAVQFYDAAAGSRTPAGREATERLIRLDLPRRPNRYVASAPRIDQAGRVFVELGNRTGLPLQSISVAVAYRDGNGQVRREQRVYRGVIKAGESALLLLGTQPYAASYDQLEVAVTGAELGPR